jgi:hypothetical protein
MNRGACGLPLPRLSIRSEMAGPALLRRYGSTALSLPSARLRNSFRPELCSNGASNSPRRPLTRAASARQVRVPEPPRDSRCRPSHLARRILSTANQRGSHAMSLPPTTPATPIARTSSGLLSSIIPLRSTPPCSPPMS